jgi:hypothetical protein
VKELTHQMTLIASDNNYLEEQMLHQKIEMLGQRGNHNSPDKTKTAAKGSRLHQQLCGW